MNETEHLLVCAAEECNEVAHRIAKALRFGLDEIQPGQSYTNAQRIVYEVTDAMAVIDLLRERHVLGLPKHDRFNSEAAILAKKKKVLRYLEYAMGRAPHPATRLPGYSVCSVCGEAITNLNEEWTDGHGHFWHYACRPAT